MTKKESSPEDEPKPVQETAQADEQKSEQKAEVSAPPSVVNPLDSNTEGPKPGETYDETDRKQDETLQSIAKQTEWEAKQAEALERQNGLMEKQTVWIRRQAIWTVALAAATLIVLVYHGMMMRGQLAQMESSSNQTNEMLRAAQKQADATATQANASQSVAEQNQKLVGHAGEQAKASQAQAQAAADQAKALLAQAEIAKQSLGIAAVAARATEENAKIASQSFMAGERPFIYFKLASIQKLTIDKLPVIEAVVTNAGRTTAYNLDVETDFAFRVMPFSSPLEYLGGRPDSTYQIPLPPGGELKMTVRPEFSVTEIKLNAIKAGLAKFYFFGKGQYTDGLDRKYFFDFCYAYDLASENLIICPANVEIKK